MDDSRGVPRRLDAPPDRRAAAGSQNHRTAADNRRAHRWRARRRARPARHRGEHRARGYPGAPFHRAARGPSAAALRARDASPAVRDARADSPRRRRRLRADICAAAHTGASGHPARRPRLRPHARRDRIGGLTVTAETVFSIANLTALVSWLLLVLVPRQRWVFTGPRTAV